MPPTPSTDDMAAFSPEEIKTCLTLAKADVLAVSKAIPYSSPDNSELFLTLPPTVAAHLTSHRCRPPLPPTLPPTLAH